MKEMIAGVQQVGIGVTDAIEAKYFYKEHFGMNVKIFDDKAEAVLMAKYTGNEIHRRHAILSMNLCGGGGFEIWQFMTRDAEQPCNKIRYGDLGIFAAKIKTRSIEKAYQYFSKQRLNVSEPVVSYANHLHFWITDPFGNTFDVVQGSEWFNKRNCHSGGVIGAVIGVSDMTRSLKFYKEILGIDQVIYNQLETGKSIPGASNENNFHRVILRKDASSSGAFGKLLGDVEIELVQGIGSVQTHIFEKRFWGDCGFIHLCFDVPDMDALKQRSEAMGHPFSVDSQESYAMESSAGRFCYAEDPDGTLIELVETHRVPVIKKLGIYIKLKNRKKTKPLPSWMVSLLSLSKIK